MAVFKKKKGKKKGNKNNDEEQKYDDGFIAFLNGKEVLSTGLREPARWDSRASSHRNSEAIKFKDFDISSFRNLLQTGDNLLAIRAINANSQSVDMLMQPALISRSFTEATNSNATVYYTTDGTDPRGQDGLPSPSSIALPFQETISLTEDNTIIARTWDPSDRGSESNVVLTDWSGPTEYHFQVREAIAGDFNRNGSVEFNDFLTLAERFGTVAAASTQTVPEPSSLLLTAIAGMLLLNCRRGRRKDAD